MYWPRNKYDYKAVYSVDVLITAMWEIAVIVFKECHLDCEPHQRHYVQDEFMPLDLLFGFNLTDREYLFI